MNQEENDLKQIVAYRMAQADETVADVKLLIENDRFRAAVNRKYYGMFYSLLALGLANQFQTSKHAQLIGWFNKNFISTGSIDPKYGKIVNKAFNRRTKGDYDTYVDFEKDIIIEMFEEMKDFIAEIKSQLKL